MKIPLNALEKGRICRTILATYHKIGTYNVFQHSFPSLMEISNNKDMAKIYRIRKLTARECFRLMALKDNEIDAIQASGISESQQYKLAGNSIVVDTLLHGIYINLFLKDGIPEGQLF